MWYVGELCAGKTLIYFPVFLDSIYDIESFDEYSGKAFSILREINKDAYEEVCSVGIGVYEEIDYDPEEPLDYVPAFNTKEETKKYINEKFHGNSGIAID